MNFISPSPRNEVLLLPQCLDDFIAQDNPVRFINQFVDSLDLRKCGFAFPKENAENRGRPAYHPASLLKLFIYGYKNGVRSGRKLEKSCKVNMEVIWLLQRLAPDFKTICDFRKINKRAFVQVSAEFVRFCQKLDLVSKKVIAIDGTSIKASNNKGKSWSEATIERKLKQYEKDVEKYLDQIEEADNTGAQIPSNLDYKGELQQKLENAQKQVEELTALKKELEDSEKDFLSKTDPDSRSLKKNGKSMVGYNVQSAVEGKSHLIISAEVTEETNDLGQLKPTIELVESTIGKLKDSKILADKGYYSTQDIKDCEEHSVDLHIPSFAHKNQENKGLYSKRFFQYDEETNTYTCPNKQRLPKVSTSKRNGKVTLKYRNRKACVQCPLKDKCTQGKSRTVERWEDESLLEKIKKNLNAFPEAMKLRGSIVEHPFGTIKEYIMPGGFLVRSREMVQAELSLAQLAYNFKRVLNLVSFPRIMTV